MVQVQEEMLQERKTEEEKNMEGEALQQEEAGDSYQTKDRPEDEKLVDSAEEGGEQELEGEEDQRSSSNCPPAGGKQQHHQHLPVILFCAGTLSGLILILRVQSH